MQNCEVQTLAGERDLPGFAGALRRTLDHGIADGYGSDRQLQRIQPAIPGKADVPGDRAPRGVIRAERAFRTENLPSIQHAVLATDLEPVERDRPRQPDAGSKQAQLGGARVAQQQHDRNPCRRERARLDPFQVDAQLRRRLRTHCRLGTQQEEQNKVQQGPHSIRS
jgi:hypothetical protein